MPESHYGYGEYTHLPLATRWGILWNILTSESLNTVSGARITLNKLESIFYVRYNSTIEILAARLVCQ